MGIMAGLMDKMGSNSMFKGKANGILWVLLFLFIKAAFLILFKLILD